MEDNNLPFPPSAMIIPMDAYQDADGRVTLHYSENIDTATSEYYMYQSNLIEYIRIKRIINDFIASNLKNKDVDIKYLNILSEFFVHQYFYLTIPLLDREDIDLYLPDSPEAEQVKADDNLLAPLIMEACISLLIDRIRKLYDSVSLGVFYGEFLRIVDATIDYVSCNPKMKIQHFMNMFLETPKLMTEQWNPNYCSAICVYPWRAFELVYRLEELMRGKRDKEAMLPVYAAIKAGVIHREWKRFEIQYGDKYCSRKTYNKYTETNQENSYYSKNILNPLIKLFKEFIPLWARDEHVE